MDVSKEYGIDSSTIEGKILARMVNNGLFPEQAQEVMAAYKASDAGKSMAGRWSDSPRDYPQAVMGGIWLGIQTQAIDWIEKNCPEHWAKPMFTGQLPDGPSSGMEPA